MDYDTFRGGDVPRMVVLITDGQSNDEKKTWEEAVSLRKEGVLVLAVGVGSGVRQRELEGIASGDDGTNVFRVNSFEGLRNIKNTILGSLCNSEFHSPRHQ